MAVTNESFRARHVTPFKSNERDFASLSFPAWRTVLKDISPDHADITITLTEKKPDRQYGLKLHKTDVNNKRKEPLMSLDLDFNENGDLTGLRDGGLTLFRQHGNMIYMFDYTVNPEDPLRVNLTGVGRTTVDGNEGPPLIMSLDEQKEAIAKEGIPLNADWFDTAVAYLTPNLTDDIMTAQFAVNTTLIGESSPITA